MKQKYISSVEEGKHDVPGCGRAIVPEPLKLLSPMRFCRADPLMLFASTMQFF